MKAQREGIGMDTGSHVDLEGCLCVHVCARNLVFVSWLDNICFSFKVTHGVFSLYRNDYFMVVVLCLIHFISLTLM